MRYFCLILQIVLAFPAISQEPLSWLRPPDSLISKAIDDGYTAKKLPKGAPYHLIRTWLKPGIGARFEVIPPLMCALDQGQYAHNNLEAKPTVEFTKAACWNVITVILVHYSQALNANWPCVFQKEDITLQAKIRTPDSSPKVVTYYPGGLSTRDVVGYRYQDTYTFEVPAEWQSAQLTYADERGNHHSFNIDFSVFMNDVTNR